ncbi:MAG: HIT family protein [Leptolyngbya sp. PLA3]|nr:MAG: HIT family protein [Cyanobacteria bacterium CYA]MCE7967511.1 HIT family protein [Leptolyngbya sp. PL-A3]
MSDSIFSKIIRKEIPAQRVYEDDACIAILDINPLAEGHTLLIPKEPAETLDALSDASSAALGRALPRLARAICKATGAEAYNVLLNNGPDAGQVVPHVHFHIIPRFQGRPRGAGLSMQWNTHSADAEQASELGRRIARLL